MMDSKKTLISSQYHGQRFDVVLSELFSEYSRSQLSQWIKEGIITLNQALAKPKTKVTAGDKVEFNSHLISGKTSSPALAEAIPLSILYEDNDVLVINKPAGLVVHPGAGNPSHTLVNALLHHAPSLESLPRAGIIHRLDKDTTGLLVVAKTLISQINLVRQMQARDIKRHYISLVQGVITSGGEINTFYGRHSKNRLKMAVSKQGKQAITFYTVRKRYPDFTLVDVQLETGRTHQIRVHMAYINHPIVGDPLYGRKLYLSKESSVELKQQLEQFSRQALHAATLSFSHPQSNQRLSFEAPLPADFYSLLQALNQSIKG